MAKIKVTLTQSIAGQTKKNRAIVAALGLRKIGQVRTYPKNRAMDEMIKKVAYMLKVEQEA
jgi:large subunit ribosomal protein L30